MSTTQQAPAPSGAAAQPARNWRRHRRLISWLSAGVAVAAAIAVTLIVTLGNGNDEHAPSVRLPHAIGGYAQLTKSAPLHKDVKWTARFGVTAQSAGYGPTDTATTPPAYSLMVVPAKMSVRYPDLRTALREMVRDNPSDFHSDLKHALFKTVDGVHYVTVAGYVHGKPVDVATMWDGGDTFGILAHYFWFGGAVDLPWELNNAAYVFRASVH